MNIFDRVLTLPLARVFYAHRQLVLWRRGEYHLSALIVGDTAAYEWLGMN